MKSIAKSKTIRPRVRVSIMRRLRTVLRPVGVETDEMIVNWALHVFCEHAKANETDFAETLAELRAERDAAREDREGVQAKFDEIEKHMARLAAGNDK